MRAAHRKAISEHEPRLYDGQITLLRATEVTRAHLREEALLGSAAMGWDRLTSGGVTLIRLRGRHNDMFYGDGAEHFARELLASMPPNGADSTDGS